MSPELRMIVRPRETYAELAGSVARVTPVTAVRRPALVAVMLGATMALSSTRHVTPALVLSTTILWSPVVMFQMAIAFVTIGGAARETIGRARAFDLFFASHAPWSLWLLLEAAWVSQPAWRAFTPLWLVILPILVTPRIIAAFFREVLELPPRRARNRTILHQAVTWGLFLVVFGAAVAIWPRILEWFA